MTLETQVLIAFSLYLIFFGWVGYRRGTARELTLLIVTVTSWVLLQERGSIAVRLANLGGKFIALLRSGGLAGSAEDALNAVASAPDIVTSENQGGFLFLVWAVIVLITYIITSSPKVLTKSRHDSWSILLGIANGFVFASLLLPILANLVTTSEGEFAGAPLENLVGLVTQMGEFLLNTLRAFWEWVQPIDPLTWLVLITLVFIIAAWTLRRGAKAKA